ncbi:hypothetical protein [Pajaroellobacter abortibovis]|nr:hypothetical protein [Pajaroellobacter abortibovis]
MSKTLTLLVSLCILFAAFSSTSALTLVDIASEEACEHKPMILRR